MARRLNWYSPPSLNLLMAKAKLIQVPSRDDDDERNGNYTWKHQNWFRSWMRKEKKIYVRNKCVNMTDTTRRFYSRLLFPSNAVTCCNFCGCFANKANDCSQVFLSFRWQMKENGNEENHRTSNSVKCFKYIFVNRSPPPALVVT
jgi:hypothetical protein